MCESACASDCVCVSTDTEEQRDSAVSCGGLDGSYQCSEDALGIFSLPSPSIPTHPLDACKYPVIQAKVQSLILTLCTCTCMYGDPSYMYV